MPPGKRGNTAKYQGCFSLSLPLFSFPQQRKVNTPAVQPFSTTGYPALLAPSTNVRGAWVDKRGSVAGSPAFLFERHLKEFYDLLRQLSLHLAQQCLSQFGRWHWQVPALLTQAGSHRCCPSTGLTEGPSPLCISKTNTALGNIGGRTSRTGADVPQSHQHPGHAGCGPHCILALSPRRDRLRTMTNVLGDALAAGIIAHVCQKDFAPKPPPVRVPCWEGKGAWDRARQAQGTCSLQKLKLCSDFCSKTQ